MVVSLLLCVVRFGLCCGFACGFWVALFGWVFAVLSWFDLIAVWLVWCCCCGFGLLAISEFGLGFFFVWFRWFRCGLGFAFTISFASAMFCVFAWF